jgi:hypothetical protein
MFKTLRILILLVILAAVALGTWRAKTRSVEWKYALPVNIYLVNADSSVATAEYLKGLSLANFQPIEKFMLEEAARYGRQSNASIELRMGGILEVQPPEPPRNGSALEVILWSLKMRWWSYRYADTKGTGPQVKLALLYYDPADVQRLDHSTGLQKGLIGRVNVFASREMAAQNNVVITHEFLHTLGATDKYDLSSNLPLHPEGYAQPDQTPLYPQQFAEIMAGRIPVSATAADIPNSLYSTLIGEKTALEINWVQ